MATFSLMQCKPGYGKAPGGKCAKCVDTRCEYCDENYKACNQVSEYYSET